MVKTKGTSTVPSDFFSMLTILMFVAIWVGGIGFLMSQKRSAEMFAIATLTRIIVNQHEIITSSRNLKLFIAQCVLYRVKPQCPQVYLSLCSPIKYPVPQRSQTGRSLVTFSPSTL